MTDLHAVKFVDGSDLLVRGLGMPYGGPMGGRDLEGEFFSAKTDFMFDFIGGERPLLYDHGLDDTVGPLVHGRVVEYKRTDDGVWTIAQLDRRARYLQEIQELVSRGILSFSSGAYPYFAQVNKSTGEIERWPWVELSLTPTPMNPYAVASKSLRESLRIPLQPDEPVVTDEAIRTALSGIRTASFHRRRVADLPS